MDHADVRAWLDDAFFLPGRLRALDDAPAADSDLTPLRAHLASCAECSAELDALHTTAAALDLALGPPPAARERVLANVRDLGRERRPVAGVAFFRRRISLARASAAVALGVVLALGLGSVLGAASRAPEEPSRLSQAVAQIGERLRDPDVQQLALRDGSGERAGLLFLSASAGRLAVFTSALLPPARGEYGCYLERDGERTAIGPMHFEGEVAFWAGPMSGPADLGRSGDRFLVTLDEADSQPALWADF